MKYVLDVAEGAGHEPHQGRRSAERAEPVGGQLQPGRPGPEGVRRDDQPDGRQVLQRPDAGADVGARPVRDRARRQGRVGSRRDSSPITTGSGEITGPGGNFTHGQATKLTNVLKYGAVPLAFLKQSTDSISPQLGASQLRRRPDRRGDRPAARGVLLGLLLPGPGDRLGLQPGDGRLAVLACGHLADRSTRASRCRWRASPA